MRRALKVWLNSVGFLSLLLSSLILVASLYAVQLDINEYHSPKHQPSPSNYTDEEIADKEIRIFGVGAEGWTAIFTGLLFVATGGLFVYTYALFRVAAKESSKAEEALQIARDTAAASTKQANAAITASRAHLRVANIFVKFLGQAISTTRTSTSIEERIFVSCKIKNYGDSPADIHDFSLGASCSIAEPSRLLELVRDFPQTIAKGDVSSDIGEEIYVTIPEEIAHHMEIGVAGIWLRISFLYIDVFNQEQSEVTMLQYTKTAVGSWRGGIRSADHRSRSEKQAGQRS